jgi:hypothetical protein
VSRAGRAPPSDFKKSMRFARVRCLSRPCAVWRVMCRRESRRRAGWVGRPGVPSPRTGRTRCPALRETIQACLEAPREPAVAVTSSLPRVASGHLSRARDVRSHHRQLASGADGLRRVGGANAAAYQIDLRFVVASDGAEEHRQQASGTRRT